MMSSSFHARLSRISRAFILLITILPACRSFAFTVDDLDPATNWEVGAISFKGNHIFGDSSLQTVMRTKPRPFYLPWKARPEFDPGAFTKDLTRLRIFYEAHGYYHLRLTYDLTTEVKGKHKIVDAELNLVEGQPVRIEDINVNIDGYHPPSDTPPMTKLPIHRGEIFNQQAYQSGQQILRLFFVNAGYARTQARRRAQVDVIKDTARIFYTVHVSSKAYFGATRLRGNKKVRAKIILRELAYKQGEEYSNQKIDDSRTHLLNLHLFSVVTLTPDLESTAREIPIDLTMHGGPQHNISLSGGYSTQDDFGGQVQWNDYNFFGDGRQAALTARYAQINSYGSASLRQPYLFDDRKLEASVTALLQEEVEDTFTLDDETVTPQLTYHLTDHLTSTVGYQLGYAQMTSVNISVIRELGGFRRHGIVSGPTAGMVWDNTDDKYYPTRGSIINLIAQQAGLIWSGDYKFYRVTLEDRNYLAVAKNTVLATRLYFGVADTLGTARDYPLFMRFFPGGEGSVRGYGRWRLGPLSLSNDPLGGLTDFEGSVEVRHPIYEKLGGAAFIDFGQTTTEHYHFPTPLRFGFGPAAMYQTPLGPLRLDLGIPSQAPRGDPWWQVYFSIGNFF
jgi:outer membrane protein assembly complex protein YaeT